MIYIFSGMHNYFFEILAQNHMQNMMFYEFRSDIQIFFNKKLFNTAQTRTVDPLIKVSPLYPLGYQGLHWVSDNLSSFAIHYINIDPEIEVFEIIQQ